MLDLNSLIIISLLPANLLSHQPGIIITLFKYQESIGMPRDINRRDHFPHMTKRPTINRPELERFEG